MSLKPTGNKVDFVHIKSIYHLMSKLKTRLSAVPKTIAPTDTWTYIRTSGCCWYIGTYAVLRKGGISDWVSPTANPYNKTTCCYCKDATDAGDMVRSYSTLCDKDLDSGYDTLYVRCSTR